MATEEEKLKLSRELFLAKVIKGEGEDACWTWGGAKYLNGKGLVRRSGKNWLAHRLAYVLFVGPIPAGMDVRHKASCHNPYCINPAHLELGPGQNKAETEELTRRINQAAVTSIYPGEGEAKRPTAMQEFWLFRKSRPAGESMEDTRAAWREYKRNREAMHAS